MNQDAPIIAMVVHNGQLYVATSEGVYIKDADGKFHKLVIEELKQDEKCALQFDVISIDNSEMPTYGTPPNGWEVKNIPDYLKSNIVSRET